MLLPEGARPLKKKKKKKSGFVLLLQFVIGLTVCVYEAS